MIVFAAVLAAVALARIVAVFTENVNWDEFALLQRAIITVQTGEVVGAGRPGLGTLILVPFAEQCRNAVDTLVRARLLWTAMVGLSVAAFVYLMKDLLVRSSHRAAALMTGIGLWIMAPEFLRFSIQVRTDQPAILCGLLAGVALLRSRLHPAWAAAAGVLLALGFLVTQKLLYVAGLVGVLTIGQLLVLREWEPRRDLIRAIIAGAAFLVCVTLYRQLMTGSAPPAMLPVARGLDTFTYYREFVGWRFYAGMAPGLLPQFAILITLLVVTLDWLRDRGDDGRQIVVAWGVLLMGLAVTLFHAGRFPYFFLVLGLFPAAVGALVTGPVLTRLGTDLRRLAFLAFIWLPLIVIGLSRAWAITLDTQSHQRESLAFIERTFPAQARGFNGRAALVCRPDPDPFPVRFNEHLRTRLSGENAAGLTDDITREFRGRPVSFMIPPSPGEPYPRELWEFWTEHYVHYFRSVFVPGLEIAGPVGATRDFDVIVPGRYVWRSAVNAPLMVGDDVVLMPGLAVTLPRAGLHRLTLPAGGQGMFALALPEPPDTLVIPFYMPLSRRW